MANKRGPNLPDLNTLLAAGINPKTGLPIRLGSGDEELLDEDIRKIIRIIDEQDAVNRYVWTGLPSNITGQELERLLYYRGQLCFFYFKELDQFFFMPYALDGTIDFYGRFNTVKPVPMTSGTTEDDKKRQGQQASLLSKLHLKVHYGVVDSDKLTVDDIYNSCVLLHDYTKQLSQTIIPRQQINDPLLRTMAECIPFMRTALIAGSGIKGMRVNDSDQYSSVVEANRSFVKYSKTGKVYMPVTGTMDIQEINNGSVIKASEYMLSMQSLDNFRKATHGIDNGGLFEKKAHVNDGEFAVNNSSVMNQLQDGLNIRQTFCNIVNSIYGLGIWCDLSENVVNVDMDGDGVAYDNNTDGSNTGAEHELDKGGNEE